MSKRQALKKHPKNILKSTGALQLMTTSKTEGSTEREEFYSKESDD